MSFENSLPMLALQYVQNYIVLNTEKILRKKSEEWLADKDCRRRSTKSQIAPLDVLVTANVSFH